MPRVGQSSSAFACSPSWARARSDASTWPARRVGRPPRGFEDRPAPLRRIADARPVAAHPHRADLLGPSGGRLPGRLHAVPRHDHARRHPHGSAKAAGVAGLGNSTCWTGSRPGLACGLATGGYPARSSARPGRPTPAPPLESLTYVEEILWLAVRLADGLAHAHEPRNRPQGLEARQHPADRRRPANVAGLQPLRRYQVGCAAPRRPESVGLCAIWPPSSWRRSEREHAWRRAKRPLQLRGHSPRAVDRAPSVRATDRPAR